MTTQEMLTEFLRMRFDTGHLKLSALARRANISPASVSRFAGSNPDQLLPFESLDAVAEHFDFTDVAHFILYARDALKKQGRYPDPAPVDERARIRSLYKRSGAAPDDDDD